MKRWQKRDATHLALLAALSLVGIGYGALMGKNGFNDYLKLKNQKTELLQDIEQMKKTSQRLKAESYFLSYPSELERLAHERLGLLKKDEILIVFHNKETPLL